MRKLRTHAYGGTKQSIIKGGVPDAWESPLALGEKGEAILWLEARRRQQRERYAAKREKEFLKDAKKREKERMKNEGRYRPPDDDHVLIGSAYQGRKRPS